MLDVIPPKYLRSSRKGGAKYNFSKYIIWVVRLTEGKNFKNAMPCNRCCKALKNYGFRKIAYSDNNGNIQFMDLRYSINKHISRSQVVTCKHSRF